MDPFTEADVVAPLDPPSVTMASLAATVSAAFPSLSASMSASRDFSTASPRKRNPGHFPLSFSHEPGGADGLYLAPARVPED